MASSVDRQKSKIASFRVKESEWADFTAMAEQNGLTATDILKSAMAQYVVGTFDPTTPSVSTELSDKLVIDTVSTAIAPLQAEIDRLGAMLTTLQDQILDTASIKQLVSTTVDTIVRQFNSNNFVSTDISTNIVPVSTNIEPNVSTNVKQVKVDSHVGTKTDAGITSAELARRIGGSKASVSRWAKGGQVSANYVEVMLGWRYIDGLWEQTSAFSTAHTRDFKRDLDSDV